MSSSKPIYDLSVLRPREQAIAKDHLLLHELCERSELIDYKVLRQNGKRPPDKYLITYKVKSIIGLDDNKMPIYGEKHQVSVELPPQYPASDGGSPICYTQTPVWHPNIRWSGKKKGYVCTDVASLGAWHKLDDLVLRVGEILKYKNYLADENVAPYPEDLYVAKWVREVGEPKGIISQNKPVDTRELLKPLPGFAEREAIIKKTRVTIPSKATTPLNNPIPNKKVGGSSVYNAGKGITIKIKKKS